MIVDLVKTTTTDDMTLDGIFFAPREGGVAGRAVDAILLVHGTGGNFYSANLLDLADRFCKAGYPCASFNCRSHDVVHGNPDRPLGNAHEILDKCRLDLDAGITWLARKGYKRIAIFGHSMGAVKVAYYAAFVPDPRVAAVIPSSPVRLSYSYFSACESGDEYRGFLEQANALIEAGQPDALISATFPNPAFYSARSYVDKQGPSERYNLVRYVVNIRQPIFLMAGTLETHPRLRDAAKDAFETIKLKPDAKLVIHTGADHGWSNMRDAQANYVLDFLAGLKPAAEAKKPTAKVPVAAARR
ncbi:MAG: alpha/beta fold hydrolase [Chloroflexi bacterium]|nr:alpha/beta fold hydrolase [Chloroflexota bacterium]